MKNVLHGIFYSASGSAWWGIVTVFYFKSVSFVGPIELVIHRTVWTFFLLLIAISILSKWNAFFLVFKDLKKIFLLFISGVLILSNWLTWIYAVVSNKLIDASFGYYIFPIVSVFFGILFFKESYNKQKLLSVLLVLISIIYLLIDFKSIPWVGIIVAIPWSSYNVLRKKVKIPADIGLFVESMFMTPLAIIAFYLISVDGNNFFSIYDLKLSFVLFLAGFVTLVPLYLYLRGVELAGLGVSGMIFFITPTSQFLLGLFYFNEYFDYNKLIGFILIWIAVIIYLRDLNNKNYHGKNN